MRLWRTAWNVLQELPPVFLNVLVNYYGFPRSPPREKQGTYWICTSDMEEVDEQRGRKWWRRYGGCKAGLSTFYQRVLPPLRSFYKGNEKLSWGEWDTACEAISE